MKKIFVYGFIILGILLLWISVASAFTVLFVPQGGTGASTFTAGHILQGNGTGAIQGSAVSGDATLAVGGALTISANAIEESMLKCVDAPADEECFTYESSTGDFEWQSCSSAQLSEEEVQDYAWNIGGGTQTLITVTYQDASSDVDFVVDNNLHNFSWANVDDGDITNTLTCSNLVAGSAVVDISTETNLTAGTGATLSGDQITCDLGTAIISSEITDGTIQEVDLKCVDAPADEECLTYETTTGDFEWQSCGAGGGALTEEEVQDYAWNVTGGNQTLISVTYQDVTNDVDFEVDNNLHNFSWANVVDADITNTLTCSNLVSASAVVDISTETNLTAGTGATLSGDQITCDLGTAIDTSEITNGTIREEDLKCVDSPVDEQCLTYEISTGDFEWQACGTSTQEDVQDYAWNIGGGTQTLISVTYQDLTNDVDFVVDNNLHNFSWANVVDADITNTLTCSNLVAGSAVVDISTETNLTAGRSLTMSADSVLADAELYTDTKCIYFEDPVAADDFKSIWFARGASTITGIWCESDQTVNMDLQVDDGTPADVNGSDLVCDGTPANDTSMGGDATLGAGERLDLAITSVSGTPTWVSICWTFTYDD